MVIFLSVRDDARIRLAEGEPLVRTGAAIPPMRLRKF
jgi:hypothetical protein